MKSKKPSFRFAEFNEEWSIKKLNELVDIVSGGTPDTKKNEYWDGDIDWYSPTEIGKSVYVNESVKKITKLGLTKSSAKILPADKTVLFTSRAGIGDMAILKKEGATNQGFQSLIVKDITDTYFLFSIGKKIKGFALKNASGSTFLEISGKNLGKMLIHVPELNEQKKIGLFFKNLDDMIALHQQELDALKQTKQGFSQKMFPKDGETVPELRFPEFNEQWETCKLGKFIKDYVEKTTIENQYPVLTSSQRHGIILQEQYFANRQVTTEKNIGYFVLPRGYFTFRSRSDNGVFKFNRNDLIDCGIISYFYPVFKIVNGDSDFFLQMLNSTIKKQIALEAEGTGQKVLSLRKFKNINVVLPEIQEQIKIGKFFRHLDQVIDLKEKELEALKQTKQGFLQKMFV